MKVIKMKNILTLLVFLFFLNYDAFYAQNIYLCNNYSEFGDPLDIVYPKEVKLGERLKILVKGAKISSTSKPILLMIDRNLSDRVRNELRKIISLTKTKNWEVIDFTFKRAGSYKIHLNSLEETITYLNVIVSENRNETDSSVLKNSKIEVLFCTKVVENKPWNIIREINLSKNKSPIYIFINNKFPFAFDNIKVKIWRKNKGESNYNNFIEAKTFAVNREWDTAFLQYSFLKEGHYKIELSDENDLLIKTAYISVKE